MFTWCQTLTNEHLQNKIQSKIQTKDSKRLQKSTEDFASLKTLMQDSKDSRNHGKLQSSSTSYGLD